MSALMAMMEEHRQLTLEQREQQKQLAEEQRDRLEKLALRQEGQMEQYVQQQRQQWEQISERQYHTEERVDSVVEDLQAVKESLHVRIQAAEESLQGLQSSQSALADGPHSTLKRELKEELCREFPVTAVSHSTCEDDPTRTTLRATAKEFVPHGGLIGPADADACGSTRPVQRPAPFDGRTAWDAYRTQFELLAEINLWNEVEKATFLAISLKGPALTVLSNLSAESRRNYSALVAALESLLGSAHQAELNRMQLRTRTRRREESLPELAEDVDRLCRLAYPGVAPAMLELLANDQFVDALTDEDMRLRIRQNRPETLRGALEAALQMESYQLASKQTCKMVRGVHIEHSQEPKRNFQKLGQQVTNCEDLVQDLQELKKQVTALKQAPRRKTPRRQNNLERVICWRCRKRGH